MPKPRHEQAVPFWPAVAAVGALVLCCAAPALLVLLAATGIAGARSAGSLTIGLGLAAAALIAALAWRRRRACP